MVSPAPQPAPQKPSRVMSIIGFLIIMGCVASILLLQPPPIKAEAVASRLQLFSEALGKDAAAVGRQATLSYGAITTAGTGYDTYIIIKDLHFSLSAPMGSASGNLTLDTPKVTVRLDPLTRARQVFQFEEPITMVENGNRKTVITMATPLRIGYLGLDKPKVGYDKQLTIRLPTMVKFDTSDANGASLPPQSITYDGAPIISVKHNMVAQKWEASAEWNDIILQSNNVQNVDVGAVAAQYEEKAAGDHKLDGTVSLSVSDMIRRENGKGIATCSLSSHVDFTSTESLLGLFGIPDKAQVKADIKKMMVACEDFTATVEGDFAFMPGDKLPSGAVTVTIDHAQAFLASRLFSDQTRSELASAMPKITGQPVDKLDKVSFPVKRNPAGALMVGPAPSTELGITLLNQWFPIK